MNIKTNGDDPAYHLTKREAFAKDILSGMLAGPEGNINAFEVMAANAVFAADELIKALNKKVEK